MRKVLFSALAVFAMFTIGALNLSASNVTSEVTESKVEMPAEVLQDPYNGDVYYWDGSVFVLVQDVIDTSHCTLEVTVENCFISVPGVGVRLAYGMDPGDFTIKQLYEITDN